MKDKNVRIEDVMSLEEKDESKDIEISSPTVLDREKNEVDNYMEEGSSYRERELSNQPVEEICDNCERADDFTKSPSEISESANDQISLPSETEKGLDKKSYQFSLVPLKNEINRNKIIKVFVWS